MDNTTYPPEFLTDEQFQQLKSLIATRCIEVNIEGRHIVFKVSLDGFVTRVGVIDLVSLIQSSAEEIRHTYNESSDLFVLAGLLAQSQHEVAQIIADKPPAMYTTETIAPSTDDQFLGDLASFRDPFA